jgi:hypothetical protein
MATVVATLSRNATWSQLTTTVTALASARSMLGCITCDPVGN